MTDELMFGETQNQIVSINYVKFTQNEEDNRIQLIYSETSDVFCGVVSQMKEIWLIDYTNGAFISFYGCQMVLYKGKMRKFDGVLILSTTSNIQERVLTYTYDVLKNQANISLESLKINNLTIRYETSRNGCGVVRNQMAWCKNLESIGDANAVSNYA